MTLQYVLTGGQLHFDKLVFAKELLLRDSPLKRLLKSENVPGGKQPQVTKSEQIVTIDYNEASDVILDEGFYELFKKLKAKHLGKLKGKVVICITALTSYHVILDLNTEDAGVIYE